MKYPLGRALLALLLGAVSAGVAFAQQPEASAGTSLAQQRLHEEVQRMLLRLVETGELSAQDAEDFTLVAPATRIADFGAILDVRTRTVRTDGLRVLAVTPGSSADALGLLSGDQLLSVNDLPLTGQEMDAQVSSTPAQRLRTALVEASDAVSLTVRRGVDEVVLSGPVKVVELPAYRLQLGSALASTSFAATADEASSCGRISVFDVAPRRQKLYRAVLIAIDGVLPGPTSSDTFRVSPGRHRLKVAEAIDSHQFMSLQQLRRDRMRPRLERYKEIDVEVQPGITYRLAAKFHLEQRHSIEDGAYWDPVIWRESPEPCR